MCEEVVCWMRPVLETLQQGCALYCNMEIRSGKATAFQEYLLRGSSCSREHMKLFGVASELQLRCQFLAFFFVVVFYPRTLY